MQALLKGKKSAHLSNTCLCNLLGVNAIHDKRIRDLALSFAPFLSKYEIHTRSGHPKTATFLLPGSMDSRDSMNVSSIPARGEMEKTLGLKIKEIETETKKLIILKKANFST